jgi:hypothetical protein
MDEVMVMTAGVFGHGLRRRIVGYRPIPLLVYGWVGGHSDRQDHVFSTSIAIWSCKCE